MNMFGRHAGWIIFGVAVAWWLVVVASGAGFNPTGVSWSFERTGQLGDSFGIISAGMAAVAAFFAFRTYQRAVADSVRLERRAAEPSFLNLIERRYDVLNRIRHIAISYDQMNFPPRPIATETTGQAALDKMAVSIQTLRRDRPDEALTTLFDGVINEAFGLSNHFRFSYHIVAYADRQFGDPALSGTKANPAYPYVRLLRAQVSDSELLLIALNCVVGEGHAKFKALVERYALLHNMAEADIELFGLRDSFDPKAFGLDDDIGSANGDSPEDA
ncbi:putative phage abortive infection protein [Brevundimonas sp.]|uniref:putative phage abortive infection protein n=1 Tax=Brevundimonas sp. TaxID=1871086 RepID=UPI0027F394A9|nr:putative phage abortive infection protein [Brevundimonas sp.]MDQ7814142.1 putative phage abortive infection protein [Brevundimonas sp.]